MRERADAIQPSVLMAPLDPVEMLARDIERLEQADAEMRRAATEALRTVEERREKASLALEGRLDARLKGLEDSVAQLAKELRDQRTTWRVETMKMLAPAVLLLVTLLATQLLGVDVPQPGGPK